MASNGEAHVAAVLRKAALFSGCDEAQLHRVAARCESTRFASGDVVLEVDSPAEDLFVVARGGVDVRTLVTSYGESVPFAIDRVYAGDVLGWSAAFERGAFSLSAVATEDSELLRLPGAAFRELCDSDADLGRALMGNIARVIARRLKRLQGMVSELLQAKLSGREPG